MSRIIRKLLAPFRAAARTPRDLRARLWVSAMEDRVVPVNFPVTNLLDSGAGSLRQAILDANATAGADTITFSVTGTIPVSSAQLSITEAVTITGPGSGLLTLNSTQAAGATSRVLLTTLGTAGGVVAISGLTISGGNTTGTAAANRGAGINNTNANLQLTDVRLDNNRAAADGGAINIDAAAASLTLTNSRVTNNFVTGAGYDGAGINVQGASTITISNSTISGNTANDDGAGIYFFSGGTLNLTNSTISGNTAGAGTGADGGGIYLFGAMTVTIRNTTMSGNAAGRGGAMAIKSATTAVTITNSTIVGNTALSAGTNASGGITRTSAGTTVIESTVVALNTGGVANGNDFSISGNLLTSNFSFIGNAQGLTITGANNQTGTTATPLNPMLTNLQDNGGGTLTRGPMFGSPLLNAGSNPAGLATDQRGQARVQGSQADIGAVEGAILIPSATLTAPAPVPGATSYSFTVTYFVPPPALINVSSIGTGDVTVSGPGAFSVTPTFVNATPNVNAGTIDAVYSFTPPGGSWNNADNGTYTVSMVANQVFDTVPTAVPAGTINTFAVVVPILVTNDADSGPGSLRDAINTANSLAGADLIGFDPVFFATARTIALTGALTITDAVTITGPGATLLTVSGNFASNVFTHSAAGAVTLDGMTMNNGSGGNGSGITVTTAGNLTVLNSVIADNSGGIGAIFMPGGAGLLTVQNSTISGNTGGTGGIYFFSGGGLLLRNSTISGNTGTFTDTYNGGGIVFFGTVGAGGFVVENSTIHGNTTASTGGGGGIHFSAFSGAATIRNSTITGNTAPTGATGGGGIGLSSGAGTVNMFNSVIAENAGPATGVDVRAGSGTLVGQSTFFGVIPPSNFTNNASNQAGTAATPLDPRLGALANNGGPTQTRLPQATSTLLNNGNNALVGTLTTDQRGVGGLRIFSPTGVATVDIGAIEVQPLVPIITLGGSTLTYTENDPALALAPAATVFDLDSTNLASATVQITSGLDPATDVLAFTAGGGITGTYTAATGLLQLTGTATLAAYQAALRSVTFIATGDNPTPGNRVITFTATDSGTLFVSAPVTRTVNVVAVNDLPILGGLSGTINTPDTAVVNPFSTVTVSDLDAASVTATVTFSSANGTLRNGATVLTSPFVVSGAPGVVEATLRGLTFTPNVNQAAYLATLTTTFNLSVTDNASPTPGVATDNTTQVVAQNVNDAPTFTAAAPPDSLEDAGAVTVSGFVTSYTSGPVGEPAQAVLNYEVVVDTNPGLFLVAPAVSPAGELTYTANPDANGSADIRVRVRDNGGVVGGGADTSLYLPFTITVLAVDDAPTFTTTPPPAVDEDSGPVTIPGFASGFSPGPADESGQTFVGYEVEAPLDGSLFSAAPAVDSAGTLTYTPAPDAFGSTTFRVRVQDSGTAVTAGSTTFSAWQTITITINPVNDAPAFTAVDPPAVNEDSGPVTVPGFVTSFTAGPANESAQGVLAYEVINVSDPSLFAVLPAVDAAGTLTYTPAADANGTATFDVRVRDTGGGADASPYQAFTITVDAVNDAPVNPASLTTPAVTTGDATPITGLFVSDDTDKVTVGSAAYQTLAGYSVTVYVDPGNGFFDGVGFTGTGSNSVNVTGTLEAVNAALATLEFTATASGTLTLTLISDDGGNVGSGGALVDSDDYPLFVRFRPVVAHGTDVALFTEDAGPVVVSPGLSVTDDDSTDLSRAVVTISGGFVNGQDELGYTGTLPVGVGAVISPDKSTITFTGTALLTDYVALLQTVTYTNTSQFPSTATRTVTFTVTDELATSLTSAPADKTVDVDDLNDAPVNAVPGTPPATIEEVSVAVPGVSVSDVDLGTNDVFVTLTTGDGTLTATGGGVTIGGSGSDTLTILGPVGAVNAALATLRYVPTPNYFGTATITMTTDDLGSTGGPAETDTDAFTVTVRPVNDIPTFTPGPNVTVDEDTGTTTIANWATNISVGPANESPQTLTFILGNDLPGVFSTAPAVAPDGTLTFTIRPNAVGTANLTIRAIDTGGTTDGGVNTSVQYDFTITLAPVNDVPSFTAGPNIDVTEDSGPRSFSGWARAITTGPDDEAGQTVSFLTSTTNGTLFSTAPAVAPDGTLTFTPAPNANGFADVSVQIRDNGGGTDTSAVQTFRITVISLNDPPQFIIPANTTLNAGPGTAVVTVPNFVTNIAPGPVDEAGQTVTFEVTNNGEVLFSQQPAISPTGTLTFAPAQFRSGTAIVTVRLRDSGGDTFGVDVTPPVQQFTIVLTGANSPPSFTAGPSQTVAEDAGPQTVPGWATNLSAGMPSESGQTLTFLVTTPQSALFAVQPAVSPSGTLTYTPAANAVGTATVTVRVMDNGGTDFGGVDTSPPQTFTIALTPVNDVPSFALPTAPVPSDPLLGARTVTGFATSIAAGPADENSQTLTFALTTSNDSLFAVLPSITATTGTLTFTPTATANGTVTVTVTLTDNGAPPLTSAAQTFTINIAVNAQNSPPTAVADAITVAYQSGPTVVTVLANDGTAPDTGETLTVTQVGAAANGTAALTGGVVTYTPAAGFSGTDTFAYTIADGNGGVASGSVTVTVLPPVVLPPPPPPPATTDLVAVFDQTTPRVRVVDVATDRVVADFVAFPGFNGGVNATVADVTGDGVPDVIVGAGAGGGPVVKVFDGRTFTEVMSFHAFLPSLRGGVHVATGDVNGDGRADLILGAGAGGGPHVKVVDGTKLGLRDAADLPTAGALLGSFFAYAGDFLGGVNVAAGDLDGDGKAEVVTGAGSGGSPHVKAFDGATLREVLSVIPYAPDFRGGVNVAVGDLNGDGKAEIVTGAGFGGGPHVGIYDGKTAASKAQFFAFPPTDTSGVTVAVRPLSAGGATLVAALGTGDLKTFTDGAADDLLDGVTLAGIAVG